MSDHTVLPLKTPRIALLALTWALGVIGGSVGINAIVKRNEQVAAIKNQVAAGGIDVNIDTSNLVNPGIVLAVGCALLSIVASIWLGLLVLDMRRKPAASASTRQPISTRTLGFQWMSLAFVSVWILATAIPVIMTAVNGKATITAFLGGRQLPDSLVAATARSIGVDPAYWTLDFVHLQVIPPWVALFFAIITTIVTFMAAQQAKSTAGTTTHAEHNEHKSAVDSQETNSPVDKPTMIEKENV